MEGRWDPGSATPLFMVPVAPWVRQKKLPSYFKWLVEAPGNEDLNRKPFGDIWGLAINYNE